MAKDPAFLFYYQDFLVGTTFMTLEETGAYIKLLCFQAAKGHLKEADILKKIPTPIWDAICVHFKKDNIGWYNERLRLEIEKRRVFTQSRLKNLKKHSHMEPHMEPHMNKPPHINRDSPIIPTRVSCCHISTSILIRYTETKRKDNTKIILAIMCFILSSFGYPQHNKTQSYRTKYKKYPNNK